MIIYDNLWLCTHTKETSNLNNLNYLINFFFFNVGFEEKMMQMRDSKRATEESTIKAH